MPNPGDDLTADLARWLAEARVDEAAASRARETSLRRQAGEEATLAGVLLDLAERGTPVLVEVSGGRRHRATVRAVADDFCALRTEPATEVLVAYAGITAVLPLDPADLVAGDRPRALDMTLVEALLALLAERPRVLVAGLDGRLRTGELRSVGRDVVVLRTDGDPRHVYVPVASIAEVGPAG
jgi:hypothetical protein